MSKELYEEAIADLKKVKEVAEDNAKRAIVEAVAPRIRELIEKELLGESVEEMSCEIDEADEDQEKDDKILTDKDKPEASSHGEPSSKDGAGTYFKMVSNSGSRFSESGKLPSAGFVKDARPALPDA